MNRLTKHVGVAVVIAGVLAAASLMAGAEHERIWVLLMASNGNTFVSDSFEKKADADKAAKAAKTEPGTWVVVTPSKLHESASGHAFGVLFPTLHADTELGAIGASLVLPQAARNGLFTSPPVTLPVGAAQIEVVFNIALADYLNPAMSITGEIEYSIDGEATWLNLCGVESGGGARIGKDGTVNPPIEFSCGVGGWQGYPLRGRVKTCGVSTSGDINSICTPTTITAGVTVNVL